jgi:hypothetical protein
MSKKKDKKKKKKHKKAYAPVYAQSSNPDQSVFNFVRNLSKEGIIVYFQTGKPEPPSACPPGGCQ